MAAGGFHSLALTANGADGGGGRIITVNWGNNSSTNSSLPVSTGLTGITAIAVGGSHSLALANNNTIWAWGNNGNGQLGDGTTVDRYTPVPVSGLTGITAIGGGGNHSIALKTDGTIWGWGYNNYGQLGDGTTTERLNPVQVVGINDATAIGVNCFGDHNLAVVPIVNVDTNAATNITTTAASLNGTLNNLISGSSARFPSSGEQLPVFSLHRLLLPT